MVIDLMLRRLGRQSDAATVRTGLAMLVQATLLALTAFLVSDCAHAEEAERLIWHGRWEYNNQSPSGNYYTSNRGDAFAFVERTMLQRMLAVYSRCATPTITFLGEQDRTSQTSLLYYGVPSWHVDYIDGSGCFYWNQANTSGEVFSYMLRFEAGPTDDRTCKTANPVQPGSGRKRLQETDYSGAGAHPLSLQRLYSSRWMGGAGAAGLAPIAAWDGGWRHSYQASLTLRANESIRAFRPDGSMLGMDPSATAVNTWVSAATKDTVVALTDASGQRTGYTYGAAADDSSETYDVAGKLLSIRRRNGWTTTLTYSDATTPLAVAPRAGLLIAVRNQFGRELRFTYDSSGRVVELLPPGAISGTPPGGQASPIRYVYEEPASLGAGVPAWGQLTSVVWQDGTIKRYHYEDGRWPQGVTGITDEAGVRYGTYSYDDQGRVVRSELAGGVDRLDFAYGIDAASKPTTTVTDYAGGVTASRTYSFTDIGGVRFPMTVSAPCPLCGNTQQSSSYNAAGDPIKQIAHDGSATFFAYDAKGRETERATFAASFQGAATRPALSNANKVVSTRWHVSFNLPTQVAEPGKVTAFTYNAKGMVTGESWTATTDTTGAAKFSAVKTGSTYATGWGYNANSLNTSIVQKVDAVEARRWNFVFNAAGDATRITATEAGASTVANLTSSTAHGLLTRLSADNGAVAVFTYNTRNQLATAQLPDYSATMSYDARSLLTEIRFGASSWLRIVYDPAGNPLRLEDSAGQSQLIVGLAEPGGLWPRSQALATAAAARLHALVSSLQDPAMATKWLPLSTARAQAPPPPAVPAQILQGMSLSQTQQAATALELQGLAQGRTCCSAAATAQSGVVQDYLNRVTMPITLMSLAATQVSEAIGDSILTQKSAYKLRKNLCAAGVTVPAGCHHAHHIVAVAAPAATNSRAILATAGVDINDACNGMFVPCDRHGRLHTNLYYQRVEAELGLAIPLNRTTVCFRLNLIRANIASGNFP